MHPSLNEETAITVLNSNNMLETLFPEGVQILDRDTALKLLDYADGLCIYVPVFYKRPEFAKAYIAARNKQDPGIGSIALSKELSIHVSKIKKYIKELKIIK